MSLYPYSSPWLLKLEVATDHIFHIVTYIRVNHIIEKKAYKCGDLVQFLSVWLEGGRPECELLVNYKKGAGCMRMKCPAYVTGGVCCFSGRLSYDILIKKKRN